MTIQVSFKDNTVQLTVQELSPTHQRQQQLIPNDVNLALSQNPSQTTPNLDQTPVEPE